MRIGFDIDGVLANFCKAYEREIITEAKGIDLFAPWHERVGPVTWDWPQHYGYSRDIVSAVWQRIKRSPTFWSSLSPLREFQLFVQWYRQVPVPRGHDLYFITARPGLVAKYQTECWFAQHLGESAKQSPPTVLMSEEKGLIAAGLKLDFYVDDKAENIESVTLESPLTRAYLIDRAYNRHLNVGTRVASLEEFLNVVGW